MNDLLKTDVRRDGEFWVPNQNSICSGTVGGDAETDPSMKNRPEAFTWGTIKYDYMCQISIPEKI